MVSRSELLDLVLQVFDVHFIRQPPLQILEESVMLDPGVSAKTPIVGISLALLMGTLRSCSIRYTIGVRDESRRVALVPGLGFSTLASPLG
jgi:hypothetical protein